MSEELRRLEKQIARARQAGDLEGEAQARASLALLYLAGGDPQAARREIARIQRLAFQAGQGTIGAMARLVQARMGAGDVPTERVEAQIKKSVRDFRRLKDSPQLVLALRELAGYYQSHDRPQEAEAALEEAAQALKTGAAETELDAARQLAEIERLRANLRLMQGDAAGCAQRLHSAVTYADQIGDRALRRSLVAQLATLPAGEVSAAEEAALLEEARGAGDLEVLVILYTRQSLTAHQAGDFAGALALAQQARDAARRTRDITRYPRYLALSLMMADIAERMGQRVQVLAALLTCRAFLAAGLGEEVVVQMDEALDALSTSWGQAGLAQAVSDYQAHVREHGPFTV